MYCRMRLAAKVILSVTSAPPTCLSHRIFHIDCETAQTCRLMNADWEVTNPESVREKKKKIHLTTSIVSANQIEVLLGEVHGTSSTDAVFSRHWKNTPTKEEFQRRYSLCKSVIANN